jgi:hypothetical protein
MAKRSYRALSDVLEEKQYALTVPLLYSTYWLLHVSAVAWWYIPPIQFVFQVTQEDLISSLMMAGYCRNM